MGRYMNIQAVCYITARYMPIARMYIPGIRATARCRNEVITLQSIERA